ncbi:hypothetical protein HOV55_gp35 [Erwinia phage vB_EhrS_59]|uniref:Uncharacterized protein n=1 Tax=Erwinia phage vB_EhrS_59 TaxID=2283025 RepID=A0A4Y1NRF1_9CAUD|nr:hypothetical protein HOV55_gp35 [Erwinia phage vB_EhrS_59]AXH43553.1 hypothetical protein MZUP2_350 [Erwinia phage vB_EhrS_59]
MTKPITTLSRERLEQLADDNTICKASWDERIEMASALLAVMDAKPIGYFHDDARAVFRVWPTKSDDCNVPVYTTPPAPSAPDCEWTFDESQYSWHSACGEDYVFTNGGPVENRVRFCQGCGGTVKVTAVPGAE